MTTLNTNLFPIISVGMYYTAIDPSEIFDNYSIDEDLENGEINYSSEFFWDNFDNVKYVKSIERIARNFLDGEHEVDGIKVTIECGEIYSPKYYNFETDQIVLNVDFDKGKVMRYAHEKNEEFNEFLKENYSSRDGFISFTANNYNDWLDDFKSDDDRSIGAVLTFLFRDEEMQNRFYDDCYSELFYSEFIDTTELDEVYKQVEDYVRDNYPNLDMDVCPVEHDDIDVMSIYKGLINKIESNTLTLEV